MMDQLQQVRECLDRSKRSVLIMHSVKKLNIIIQSFKTHVLFICVLDYTPDPPPDAAVPSVSSGKVYDNCLSI